MNKVLSVVVLIRIKKCCALLDEILFVKSLEVCNISCLF